MKSLKLLTLLMVPLIGLCSCQNAGNGGKSWPAKEYLGEKSVGESSVKIYGANEGEEGWKTVGFEETNDLCEDNEGMGWVILEEPLWGGLPSLGYRKRRTRRADARLCRARLYGAFYPCSRRSENSLFQQNLV